MSVIFLFLGIKLYMELADKILALLPYENKVTSDTESFGIYRVPTSIGCLEFVKLYTNISYQPHIHDFCSAQFIFLSGKGYVTLDGEYFSYHKGSVYNVPAGVIHGFIIEEDTIFLSIQSNPIQDTQTGKIDIRYE